MKRALAASAAGAVLLTVIVRCAWVCDDAFITLRTIDNLMNGHGMRWNIAERVQTFTHPLWMLLLTGFYSVTREPYYTTLAVSILLSGVEEGHGWPHSLAGEEREQIGQGRHQR